MNRLINADCLEVMAQMPDNSVDVVITDPPYYTTNLKFDRDQKIDFEEWFEQAHRICKPDGAVILFSQQPFTTDLINANRKNYRLEIIWEKTLAMGFLNAKKRPLRAHENIIVFSEKGYCKYNPQKVRVHSKPPKKRSIGKGEKISHYNQKKVASIDDGTRYPRSVLKYSNSNYKSPHPTAKPLDLIEWLVKTYSNTGDIVFDPFAGSATTAIAAINTGRNYIAVEKDSSFYELSLSRIDEANQLLEQEYYVSAA